MDTLILISATAIALFISAYVHKRRFGLLGLALTAGSILSAIWGYNAELVIAVFGIRSSPLTSAVVLVVITLLPAAILLFHGYVYKTMIGRLVGALLFTLLALAFLIEPIGHILMPSGIGLELYDLIIYYKNTIIGVGLMIAIIDLFFTKPAILDDKRHKH